MERYIQKCPQGEIQAERSQVHTQHEDIPAETSLTFYPAVVYELSSFPFSSDCVFVNSVSMPADVLGWIKRWIILHRLEFTIISLHGL